MKYWWIKKSSPLNTGDNSWNINNKSGLIEEDRRGKGSSTSKSLSAFRTDPSTRGQGQSPGLHSSSVLSQVHAPWKILGSATRSPARMLGLMRWESKTGIVNVSRGSTVGRGDILGLSLCLITVTVFQVVLTQAYCSGVECTLSSVLTFALQRMGGSQSLKLKTNSFFGCLQCKSLG